MHVSLAFLCLCQFCACRLKSISLPNICVFFQSSFAGQPEHPAAAAVSGSLHVRQCGQSPLPHRPELAQRLLWPLAPRQPVLAGRSVLGQWLLCLLSPDLCERQRCGTVLIHCHGQVKTLLLVLSVLLWQDGGVCAIISLLATLSTISKRNKTWLSDGVLVSLLPWVAVSCWCWLLLFPTEEQLSDTVCFCVFLHFFVSDRNLSHSGRNDRIRSELLYVITMYD